MSRKKVDLSKHLEDHNPENDFENIDSNGDGDTSKQDIAESEAKAARVERQRRKVPTPAELLKAAKLMGFEDRAVTILALRNDLRADIEGEAETQEKALAEQQAKLDRINALKTIE